MKSRSDLMQIVKTAGRPRTNGKMNPCADCGIDCDSRPNPDMKGHAILCATCTAKAYARPELQIRQEIHNRHFGDDGRYDPETFE